MPNMFLPSVAAVLLLAAAAQGPTKVSSDALRTINPTGGTNMADGVRLAYSYNSFQIVRSEIGGFAGGDKGNVELPSTTESNLATTFLVAIGSETYTVDTDYWYGYSLATSTTSEQSCENQLLASLTIFKNDHSYELLIHGMYTAPDNYVRLKVQMTIPAANTEHVIVYVTGKGQALYNNTGEVGGLQALDLPGIIATKNANSYDEEDSHFYTIFGYIRGNAWTGKFVGNPGCGFGLFGCDSHDSNVGDYGPITQTHLPSHVNTQPLNAANMRTTISIDFGTSGTPSTEFALGMITQAEVGGFVTELAGLGRFRESICEDAIPFSLEPVTLSGSQVFHRVRVVAEERFHASDKFVTSENYTYFETGGFENYYIVVVQCNVGRIRIPLARNTSGVSLVRVTIIPVSMNSGAYKLESASQPAMSWIQNDLPQPPLFRYVKVEIGQRAGIDMESTLHYAIRVEVLNEFEEAQPFFVPITRPVPGLSSSNDWNPSLFGMPVANGGLDILDFDSAADYVIPLVIHAILPVDTV
jgi:hypothetical protein